MRKSIFICEYYLKQVAKAASVWQCLVDLSMFLTCFLKVALLHIYCSRFLNCTNGTKSRNASHMFEDIRILDLMK